MGSEDLFRKRKARKATELARQQTVRSQNPRYLIICEGEKTEPLYFGELVLAQKIPHHRVKITRRNSSSPASIVEQAHQIQINENAQGDGYDKIYCVFDRDKHTTFVAAINRVTSLQESGVPIVAITSTPCFEFWLLLHFDGSDAPFHAAGKKSIGDQAISKLKKHPKFAKYNKGQKGIYDLLENKTATATKNALRIRKNSVGTSQLDANPWTNVDELVCALLELAKR